MTIGFSWISVKYPINYLIEIKYVVMYKFWLYNELVTLISN